ncbi:MAG TPA: glucose-6-phosphate dehydrogenase assembly protein OpcA [Chloroflexota bacterium]
MTTTASQTLHWSGADTDLTVVERQISHLRKEISRRLDDASPVVTHIFNLVVYTSSHEQAEQISLDLTSVSQQHPSRAIIVIADRWHEDSPIDAEVRLMCVPQRPGRPPLCYEQVFVTVQGRAADHLSSVVVPLLLPELPTYLWWPGQPPFGHRLFHRLLSATDKLVVDSGQFASPGDGFNDLARLCSGRHGVNDIHWLRLRPWREIIAQFFDAPRLTPYARGIYSVTIEFGSGEGNYALSTAGLLLMLGWVACELGMSPETTLDVVATRDVALSLLHRNRLIPIDVNFRDHGSDAAGKLMMIELRSAIDNAPEGIFEVERSADFRHAHVTMRIGDESEVSRVVSLETGTDLDLLAAELAATGHDHLYERVVEMAARIAGRELWVPD